MELSKQEMELFILFSDLRSKNFLWKWVSKFYKDVQYCFWKQEKELSNQEMDLFFLLSDLQSKNFIYKMFQIFTNQSMLSDNLS